MEIWAAIIGAIVGILLTSGFGALRNKYVVRSQPLVAMRNSANMWGIRNRSSTRLLLMGGGYSDEQNVWHSLEAGSGNQMMLRGYEVTLGPIPDGVLAMVYWQETPMFSRRLRFRTGDFYTKRDEANVVVTPREMSPHGGK